MAVLNTETTVYAVYKQGVYRHECGGVFTTIEQACATATRLISREPDDYHIYEIVPYQIDTQTEQDPDGNIKEHAPIFKFIFDGEKVFRTDLRTVK